MFHISKRPNRRSDVSGLREMKRPSRFAKLQKRSALNESAGGSSTSMCRKRSASRRSISGLLPGNPKMKTARPTTERLLAQFDGLHLLIEETTDQIRHRLIEELNPLQTRILELLEISPKIYRLHLTKPKFLDSS